MITQGQVTGKWNELKGRIQEQWGELTDDDLHKVEGKVDQLVGLIQQKTGQAKAKIEETLESLSAECNGMMGKASDVAREYADRATEAVSQVTEQVRQRATEGYEDARRVVRRHPAESVAAAFCTGMIAGLVVGLTLRSR